MVPGRMPYGSPNISPRGSRESETSAVLQACASIGVHPAQSLSSIGRRRSIVGGIAKTGPVRSRKAVSFASRFMWIAMGGRYSSVLSASVVLNAALIRHAARFWMATNG